MASENFEITLEHIAILTQKLDINCCDTVMAAGVKGLLMQAGFLPILPYSKFLVVTHRFEPALRQPSTIASHCQGPSCGPFFFKRKKNLYISKRCLL